MGKSRGNRINKKLSVSPPSIFVLDRFLIIIKNCLQLAQNRFAYLAIRLFVRGNGWKSNSVVLALSYVAPVALE